jgi:hypothetical protein
VHVVLGSLYTCACNRWVLLVRCCSSVHAHYVRTQRSRCITAVSTHTSCRIPKVRFFFPCKVTVLQRTFRREDNTSRSYFGVPNSNLGMKIDFIDMFSVFYLNSSKNTSMLLSASTSYAVFISSVLIFQLLGTVCDILSYGNSLKAAT